MLIVAPEALSERFSEELLGFVDLGVRVLFRCLDDYSLFGLTMSGKTFDHHLICK
jgi:hypothetical protein